MKQVYISYAREDRQYRDALREYMTAAGYKVRTHRGSSDWSLSLFDIIRDCDAVIPIISEAGAESRRVTYEWSVALGAGVLVYPVMFRATDAHPHLMILKAYDFNAYNDPHDAWEQFMREFQRVLGDDVQMTRLEPSKRQSSAPSQPAPERSTRHLTQRERDPQPERDTRLTGYYLEVQRGSHAPEEYPLRAESITVGRDGRNDIQIPEEGVSRSHLRFVRVENGYQVMDMGSTNGTYLANGDKIQTHRLKSGDVLTIGHISLTFRHVE